MCYRIVISLAAATLGISCIATDASAGFGGFHFGGFHQAGVFRATRVVHRSGKYKPFVQVAGSAGGGGGFGGSGAGAGGVGAAAPSYYGRTACGHYPYPPCRRN
jgi:hypothetical protein